MFNGALTVQLAQGLLGNLLVFFAMAFTVELSLVGFKVQNPRIRAFFRCLPIVKLPLGLVLYGIIDVNLFSCQSLLKPVFCELFFTKETFLEYSQSGLSLPSYFAAQVPQKVLFGFFAAFLAISVSIALKRAYQCLYLIHYLRKVCRKAKKVSRPILNLKLKNALKERNIQLLMSDAFSVPVAAGKRFILIPKGLLNELSQSEFEAVVAHELEHLRWNDPLVKFLCTSICLLFWWIPTGWWLKRLEEEQEHASDRGIYRFGYEGSALASALVKVLKQGSNHDSSLLCRFTAQKHLVLQRVEKMLAAGAPPLSGWGYGGIAVALIAFILIGYTIC
jgi:Zn-dependent protease with chaperone function